MHNTSNLRFDEGSLVTPYGKIPKSSYGNFVRITGNKLVEDEWVLLSDEIECWQVNKNNERKANESHFVKLKVWMPIRDLNFQYAMAVNHDDLQKALAYAENKLFEGVTPVYLPDKLWQKNSPVDYDPKQKPPLLYRQILDREQEMNKNS